MTRGRKPKPVELSEADGNPGRRPLPVPVRSGAIDATPPSKLGKAGVELWNELVERLSTVGALDQLDRAGLTALCTQWDRAADAGKLLAEEGHWARGSMGQLVPHPALAVERAAQLAVLRFLAEYAATPVARARIATAQAARKQQQEFEELTSGEPVEIDDPGEIDPDVL